MPPLQHLSGTEAFWAAEEPDWKTPRSGEHNPVSRRFKQPRAFLGVISSMSLGSFVSDTRYHVHGSTITTTANGGRALKVLW